MKRTAFDSYHPCIAAVYFAVVLVSCMAAFHPVLVGLSLVAGFAASVRLRGARSALLSVRWQLPLLVIIALANPIFSPSGSTLLVVAGPFPIYAESLAYGACMGAMLVAAMLWFSNAAQVMSSDKTAALLGARLPVVGLMITMVMRLVPQFVRRGEAIGAAAAATTAAGSANTAPPLFARPTSQMSHRRQAQKVQTAQTDQKPPANNALAARVRQISVLMGWGMEDSLEMSDAMRARGWGASRKRTTYQRVRFGVMDAALLAIVIACAVCLAVCGAVACGQAAFYPVIVMGQTWWLAAGVYLVVLAIPVVLEVIEWLTWRSNS